ncbi:thioredoxin-like 4, chloroplastic isoform X1 [Miscanthus floridulus]|uniref:thioredoxin-like 4, chloroplastic isoform X1 n=1 Tax=Miscanthus floridulus TaxID=154761 RepID=UPI003459DB84
MIASSLLPLRSVFVLPSSAASRSRPATATLLPVPRISLSRRFAASATESSSEEEEAAARSTNGSLPGLPPVEEEEEEFCPVDCVTEFKTDEEFQRHLERSKATGALVVVDFYRPSCGSCKYIEKGFIRLCKGSGDDGSPVVFLKHNVIDEYDEQSEVADRLRIKIVPLFHFYKDGVLVESFATRDKERILAAIRKYTSAEQEPEEEEQQE